MLTAKFAKENTRAIGTVRGEEFLEYFTNIENQIILAMEDGRTQANVHYWSAYHQFGQRAIDELNLRGFIIIRTRFDLDNDYMTIDWSTPNE